MKATIEHNFAYHIKPVLTLACYSCRGTEHPARMRFWSKSALVLGLTLWTTGTTWLSLKLLLAFYPGLVAGLFPAQIVAALPVFGPFFAGLIAFRCAVNAPRSGLTTAFLFRYFLVTPCVIYLLLLGIVALMTHIFAPITFVVGLFLGLRVLLLGILMHATGLALLWPFQGHLFGHLTPASP